MDFELDVFTQSSGLFASCARGHRLCLETYSHCLEVGGAHASSDIVRALLDCAELLAVCESLLGRGSDAVEGLLPCCADVAERSARDCERFDDRQMRACAEACRVFAETCRMHLFSCEPD